MKILDYIDYVLDRITMYRVALYYVIAILVLAVILSFLGVLSYTPLSIIASTGILLLLSLLTNFLFANVYDAPINVESAYITALILACILPPLRTTQDLSLLIWAPILAMASKYILAIRNKHIFNPAAIAVVLTGLWFHQSAIWWVGTQAMAPLVIIGGVLMVRKLRHWDMIYSFFIVAFLTSAFTTLLAGHDLLQSIQNLLLQSPYFFFAFVMLTEPLTSPTTNFRQILFAGIVGFFFAPQVHFGNHYFTPEEALVIGNIFAYLVSPKIKERLLLVRSEHLTPSVMEFEFKPSRPFNFRAGQYMEFTLPHQQVDSRGNRRYLTIASSPTENTLRLGVKFYPNSSSFKQNLYHLEAGQTLMGGQLAGNFTLPRDPKKKLVFIAGGIGVTPYRSMVKYLSDTGEKRAVTLLYAEKTAPDLAYIDIFKEAEAKIGLKPVYILSDAAPEGWTGRTGLLNAKMISEEVPDYRERTFYISGPHGLVSAMEHELRSLGVGSGQIVTDFFPGLV